MKLDPQGLNYHLGRIFNPLNMNHTGSNPIGLNLGKNLSPMQTNRNSLKARFKTICQECSGEIKVGSNILKNSDGKWIHSYCAEEPDKLP